MTSAATAEMLLDVQKVSKVFVRDVEPTKSATTAIDCFSLSERRGAFVSIVGPSGCGKTTLLKLIAGLERATSGTILIDGRAVDGPSRNAVYVFQEYSKSLLPWRTVLGNVRLGLESRRLSQAARTDRAARYLALVDLEHAADKYPWELSGGMQQRVVVARALACEPAVLLFDEPFGSIDAMNRAALEDKVLCLWRDLRPTILFVTHDIDEAIYLADRVLVLRGPPAAIIEDIAIDLPRPRDQAETRANPVFVNLRKRIYSLLFC